MNAEYIAKSLEAITVTQGGETSKPLQEFADFVRQQQAEIEALKLQLHTTLTNRDLRTYDGKAQEKTIQSVMAEYCTCYKLGYSQLNDYAKVKAK